MGILDIAYVNMQAQLKGWSDEYRKVRLTYCCQNPTCKAKIVDFSGKHIDLYLIDREGNKVDESSPKAEFFVCGKCQNRWTYKKELTVNSSKVRIEETNTQILGTEESFVKNSSHAQIERRIEVSKQWSNSYSVSEEKATKVSDSVTLGIDKYSSFKSLCEETLKKSNSTFNGEISNHQESLCITVPPNSSVKLKYHWKSKIFRGTITFFDDLGREIPELQTPYEVASGITLDIEVENLEPEPSD